MNALQALASAALAAASLIAHALPPPPVALGRDYSDLWWNPQESGWGMNVVQQGETAFVTLFVHGPDGAPTWYVASDARVFALDASGSPAFRGTLYKAKGAWIGGPWDPSKVAVETVGQLVIEPRPPGRLFVEYTAEGATVQRTVERQTFSVPDLGATYLASFSLRQALPGGPTWGTRQFSAETLVHLDGDVVFLRVEDPQGRCDFRGTRTPAGRQARVDGTYGCATGESGTFEITGLEVTEHGLSGYLRTATPGNQQYGRFAGARL